LHIAENDQRRNKNSEYSLESKPAPLCAELQVREVSGKNEKAGNLGSYA